MLGNASIVLPDILAKDGVSGACWCSSWPEALC